MCDDASKMTEITDCQSMRRPQWTVVDHGFEPEFTIAIFIHYKPRIALAILDL